ncbi:hypothetical protein CC202_09435 [Pseudomonas savastanoi]|uniref:hypothetical protein n=1 Tax=Pseudomonas savastanoi TaxID=29438 RepID=UPI000BA46553|nr:hypothetical protein [Pseudomonas savastanoi]PAB33101.1 hypothetical protein CC202_09435 [Pseudomonas savastanoi]
MKLRNHLILKYTTDVCTFLTVECDSGFSIEVFGDGDNATYEWRIVSEKGYVEQHSNCAYGMCAIALRDGLIAYYGLPEHGTEAVDLREDKASV